MARRVPKRLALLVCRELQRLDGVPATPKMLQVATRGSLRSINRVLEGLVSSKVVEKAYYGHYRLTQPLPKLTRDPSGVLGVHGLTLVGENWPSLARSPYLLGSDGTLAENLPLGHFGKWEPTGGDFLEHFRFWGARAVRFRWFPGAGTLVIYLSASQNPLDYEEMTDFVGWLRGICDPLDPEQKLELRHLGLNRDHRRWELDGFQRIRLVAWKNAFRQVYQKRKEIVRDEAHLTLRELTLGEAVEMIAGVSPAALIAKAIAGAATIEEARARLDEAAKKLTEKAEPPPIRPDSQSGYG